MAFRIYLLLSGIIFLNSCQTDLTKKSDKNIEESIVELQDNTITNLYDAFGKSGKNMTKDFGFSALIKYNGKLILFDSGTNADILKKNAEALGINLQNVDFAVGSHAHGDHLNGFDYLLKVNPKVKIFLPFDSHVGAKINFNIEGREKSITDSLPEEMRYFGGEGENMNPIINYTGRFWNANVEYVDENKEIEPGVNLIATQSLHLGYGSKYPTISETKNLEQIKSTNKNEIQFKGLPELSLSLSTKDGEVLVVGCSHSSVQNIMNETIKLTKRDISLLYGGYHLLPYNREEITLIANQLKNDFRVKKIAPTHCTGHLAFKLLKDAYKEQYIFAGLGEKISIQ